MFWHKKCFWKPHCLSRYLINYENWKLSCQFKSLNMLQVLVWESWSVWVQSAGRDKAGDTSSGDLREQWCHSQGSEGRVREGRQRWRLSQLFTHSKAKRESLVWLLYKWVLFWMGKMLKYEIFWQCLYFSYKIFYECSKTRVFINCRLWEIWELSIFDEPFPPRTELSILSSRG